MEVWVGGWEGGGVSIEWTPSNQGPDLWPYLEKD